MIPHLLELLAVLAAALIVGFTGFGFNVFAVPALALVMPAKEAVVIALVSGALVNAAMATVASPRKLRVVGWLLLASLPGMLAGAWIYSVASEALIQLAVGILTCAFAFVVARHPSNIPLLHPKSLTLTAGTTSGMLTTLAGMGGPPVAALLSRTLDGPQSVRASMAAYSAAVSTIGLLALAWSNEIERQLITRGAALAIPGLVGLLVGARIFRSRQGQYSIIVGAILLAMGALMSLTAAIAITRP